MRIQLVCIIASFIVALTGCEREAGPTYRPYSEMFKEQSDTARREVLALGEQLKSPQPAVLLSLDSPWYFSAGDSTEGFRYGEVKNGKETVALPHRILLPNRPLWYERRVSLPSVGVLRIRADDGAQLYIDGKSVARIHDEFFPVIDGDTLTITVRVLNNAMAGGLRSVQFLTVAQYKEYVAQLLLNRRLRHLVERTVLLTEPAGELAELTAMALTSPTETNVARAEDLIADKPMIVGPWIQRNDDRSITIRALTDREETVTIRYGTSPSAMNNRQSHTDKVFSFRIAPSDTSKLYYQLICRQTTTPVYDVTTTEQSAFSFNAWADSQSGWRTFQTNLGNLDGPRDAFGIGAGDLVGDGSDLEEWRTFYNVLSSHSPSVPFYLIAGNHDYDGFYDKLDPVYYRTFNRFDDHSYYSWSYGNCSFIMLDPNETFPISIGPGSQQYEWFMNELQSPSWKKATWRFVVLHQPPYSQGWPGYSGDHFLRRLLDPIVEAGGVDFVVAGHTHDYERFSVKTRSGEATYLILGGAGGSLESAESSSTLLMDTVVKRHHMGRFFVDGQHIRFQVRDTDGNLIDSLSRRKPPGW